MRIEIACFTGRGYSLGKRLRRGLLDAGDDAWRERCGDHLPVREWVVERFPHADALVFIGAVGIAVRAVAPLLVSKTTDPAVVVVDDCGKFAVSLLSGHIGGANALTDRIAELIGAQSVITTATDGSGVFAIDVWAVQNGFFIANPERIKDVSATLLSGREVGLQSMFPISGALPSGLVLKKDGGDVLVGIYQNPESAALLLVPPAAVLGVGCRKNTPVEVVEKAFHAFCLSTAIHPRAFGKVCSIDIKKGEPGLKTFCASRSLPFETFEAGELAAVGGNFNASAFVASVTGVDNVCERSAVLGSGGALVAGKTVFDGVAMAAAVGKCTVEFGVGDGESS